MRRPPAALLAESLTQSANHGRHVLGRGEGCAPGNDAFGFLEKSREVIDARRMEPSNELWKPAHPFASSVCETAAIFAPAGYLPFYG